MSRKARWIQKRRQVAQANGLCMTCCKVPSREGRKTCQDCSASAIERIIRKRQALQKNIEQHRILVAHEQTGDTALEGSFYAVAAQYFEDGLSVAAISNGDKVRLLEKIIQAFSLSDDPVAANRWLDKLLVVYLQDRSRIPEAITVLQRMSRQLWLEAKTAASILLDEKAIKLADSSGDLKLQIQAYEALSSTYIVLGRFTDAERLLHTIEVMALDEAAGLPKRHHWHKAAVLAAAGQAEDAYRHFDIAAELVQQEADPYGITIVWETHAVWALALGDTQRSKNYYERALIVARQHNITWRIPYICLDYADILSRMGQEHTAYEYLLEALSYGIHVPLLDLKFAAVGIPLAVHMHDTTLLVQLASKDLIERAFESGQPCRIGPVISAFARYFIENGKMDETRALLGRAIRCVTYVDESFDLFVLIGRYGNAEDMEHAYNLLQARVRLPHAEVASALSSLFEAHRAHREGRSTRAYAQKAIQQFIVLQWHTFANEARALLPVSKSLPIMSMPAPEQRPLSDIRPALTTREQEVAELALRRFTNREIAQTLAISENTVEKHMTSIMGRLGVHSRRQLASIFITSDTP